MMSAGATALSIDPFDRRIDWREPTDREKDLDCLEARLTELWGHINAANYRFLALVAEYDRREGYAVHGLANCAQWLNWQCGIGDGAAREKVRVARALEHLPKITAAFRAGRISYSKVRAMTRVARPEDEHVLLDTALFGTAAHVERHVRKFRACERRGENQQAHEHHRRRYVSCFHDEDGAVVIHAVLPPEVGAIVRKAIEAAVEEIDEPATFDTNSGPSGWQGHDTAAETESNVSAETSEDTYGRPPEHGRYGAKRADALRLLAETYLDRRAASHGSVADRFQVSVHIDHRLLSKAQNHMARCGGDGTVPCESLVDTAGSTHDAIDTERIDTALLKHCEIDGGDRPLVIETARRLACDASLIGIVDDANGEPLSLGRRTRAISPALNRALKSRDAGCRFPGCGRTRFTEGHHVVHWADGGRTELSNLVTLCNFHHRLIHEGGFGLHALDDGPAHERFVFTRPDGSRLEPNGRHPVHAGAVSRSDGGPQQHGGPQQPPADDGGELPLFELNRRAGLDIDAGTSRTEWLGERMDYSTAVELQLYCRRHERTVDSVRYDADCRRREVEQARARTRSRRKAPCCREH